MNLPQTVTKHTAIGLGILVGAEGAIASHGAEQSAHDHQEPIGYFMARDLSSVTNTASVTLIRAAFRERV